MQAKTFEVRDRMTFIPALAVKLDPACERDRYLLARAGYGLSPFEQAEYVLLVKVSGDEPKTQHDPHSWGDRTMRAAHQHIIENWSLLESGAVVDVEFILGEKQAPTESEARSS